MFPKRQIMFRADAFDDTPLPLSPNVSLQRVMDAGGSEGPGSTGIGLSYGRMVGIFGPMVCKSCRHVYL